MDNNAAEGIPPVLPLELCAMSTNDFAELLAKQQTRISHTLTSQKEIEMIEDLQFCNETGLQAISTNKKWNQEFIGCIAGCTINEQELEST